jgi:hypothetical protein
MVEINLVITWKTYLPNNVKYLHGCQVHSIQLSTLLYCTVSSVTGCVTGKNYIVSIKANPVTRREGP